MRSITEDYIQVTTELSCLSDCTEKKFLEFARSCLCLSQTLKNSQEEAQRLQDELVKSKKEISGLQAKLKSAREMLDAEIHRRQNSERYREDIIRQKEELENLISSAQVMLGQGQVNETKEKLQIVSNSLNSSDMSRLNPSVFSPQINYLTTINESCGSVLSVSDIELTREDLDFSKTRSGKMYRTSSFNDDKKRKSSEQPSNKRKSSETNRKRKSSEKLNDSRKKHKLEEEKEINVDIENRKNLKKNVQYANPTAPSIIEIDRCLNNASRNVLTPIQENHIYPIIRSTPMRSISNQFMTPSRISGSNINQRQHDFQEKTVFTDTCTPCGKRINFAKTAYKCKDCRLTCHLTCKDLARLPCIPIVFTPNKGNQDNPLLDYAPSFPPLVPAIVQHCTREIEDRGLNEVGLYRVPGSEKDVKELREKFNKGRGSPNLCKMDTCVIAGTVKDFLKSCSPLITYGLWQNFVDGSRITDKEDSTQALYQAVAELPRANRDTLAWFLHHLQNVAVSPECKMPIINLAKVFGPTIVGYSKPEFDDPMRVINETPLQYNVMLKLLEFPTDYWTSFLNAPFVDEECTTPATPEFRSSIQKKSILKTPLARFNSNSAKKM